MMIQTTSNARPAESSLATEGKDDGRSRPQSWPAAGAAAAAASFQKKHTSSSSGRRLIDFTLRTNSEDTSDDSKTTNDDAQTTTNHKPINSGKRKDIEHIKRVLQKYDKSFQTKSEPDLVREKNNGTSQIRFPSFRSLDRSSFIFQNDNGDYGAQRTDERIEFLFRVQPRRKRQERASSSTRQDLILEFTRMSRQQETKQRNKKSKPRSNSLE
mmetsp:Transcript_10346/g.17384  ORF Transcript_10346/g.17384 Transcript_10346/m.17384 type:complete len:213 (-) Transcript_10346:68-706(-)